MTLLERLHELNATRGRAGNEADRNKDENLWVRDVALPALIEVSEAAREVARVLCYDNLKRLDAALAKLEVPHED